MITASRRRSRDGASDAAATGRDEARELGRLVAQCAAAGIGRSALVLRLSRLPAERTQPHHLRLARSTLDPLRAADRARRFELANHDIVCIWRGEASEALRTCRRAVDLLFADDTPEGAGEHCPDGMWQVLTLPEDAAALQSIIEASLAPEASVAEPPRPIEPPLDLPRLGALEASLQQADMARFARRLPVAVLGASSAPPTLAWEKRFLSIDELSAALMPERSARADPWLFRRLTRTLDRRMLALLSHAEELRDAGPFSLNLNIATILSPEFLRFDAGLPARLRGEVILEVSAADVMADASAFLFAREFARVRGYRLLLRGLTPVLLLVFPPKAMAVDWLELRWSPDLAGQADPVADIDPAILVLGRADGPAALAWARERGITRIRGPAIQAGGAWSG